jgi:predicted glycosyltransferase
VRIFSHAQSLSGVGHFVRAFEIARALGERHEVHMLDGGWPVPRARRPAAVRFVEVPKLQRSDGRLVALDGHRALAETLGERIAVLERAVRALRPHVVIVEHFPFSKWELEAEVRATIAAARDGRPAVKVVCSLRDVARKTRFDDGPHAPPYRERVLAALGLFDAVLVHADPRFTRIEEHLPWMSEPPVPLAYTGFVSEKLPAASDRRREILAWLGARRAVVASAGGSGTGLELLRAIVAAWRGLESAGRAGHRVLVAFGPLRSSESELEALRRSAGAAAVRVERFDPDFLEWLAVAELSIGRAGYNTCANLLETRRRALLIPDPAMSDQPYRARRFAELGLAHVLEDPRPEACAEAILQALGRPEPAHDFALDGAERTRSLIEALNG